MSQVGLSRGEAHPPLMSSQPSTPMASFLQSFLQMSRESCDFYDELSGRTDNAILRNVFINIARRKRALLSDLGGALDDDVEVARRHGATLDGHDWARSLRKIYRYGRTQFDNDDEQFIGWLEVAERHWLRGCEEVLSRLEPPLRLGLQTHLPRLREMHAEMCSLSRIGSL